MYAVLMDGTYRYLLTIRIDVSGSRMSICRLVAKMRVCVSRFVTKTRTRNINGYDKEEQRTRIRLILKS